ncbi:MAG: branched-chain amino acid transporter permease [Oscillospiraceae bacterium]
MNTISSLLMIFVVAFCTYLTRATPFWLFRGSDELPGYVGYLGRVLPMAIMATLIVYCLKSTSFTSAGGWVPQLVAGVSVAALHLWKRNTLLSIFAGTALYMLLVQKIF